MTEARSALTVEAVVQRFSSAEQLLTEAAEHVRSLGDSEDVAKQAATSLTQAARVVSAASEQLVSMTAEMQRAHAALVEAMTLAQQFLASTDVSAVRTALDGLAGRVSALESSTSGLGDRLSEVAADQERRLEALRHSVDRTADLQSQKEAAERRLAGVMAQLPGRVAKKVSGV